MSLELFARVLGGIGLFLLGVRLMTDGLRLAAGPALQQILARSTRTRLRGVASGFLVTSLVQSSSAVTVASIGFVNAGLLNLAQALAVTYGSNIGTTATGWLVAGVGFHVDVRAFALPLVGVGMALRLGAPRGRLGSLGEALAGFGIFFLGIDVLNDAFAGIGDGMELGALTGEGPLYAPLFVAIGFGLTVLMQSSSAAIAIILTAAAGGVVSLGSGAALVIGANVGTTSTAALAVIGATPNARRVAAGHVAFNVITGGVALVLLPLLLFAIVQGREALDLESQPAAVLAGFHTLFNLLGVALLWPLTPRLVRFLEHRFRSREEDEARPRYLDRNVVATPQLAVGALVLELARAGQIVRRIAGASLGDDRRARAAVPSGERALAALVASIGEYTQLLHRGQLPPDLDALPPSVLRVSRYYSEAAELAGLVAAARDALEPALEAALEPAPETVLEAAPETVLEPAREKSGERGGAKDAGSERGGAGAGEDLPAGSAAAIDGGVRAFVAQTCRFVEASGIDVPAFQSDRQAEALAALEASYQALKSALLEEGSEGRVGVRDLVALLDWLSNVRRMAQQLERGTRFLASLTTHAGRPGPDDGSATGAANEPVSEDGSGPANERASQPEAGSGPANGQASQPEPGSASEPPEPPGAGAGAAPA